jgi:hypothetical protein
MFHLQIRVHDHNASLAHENVARWPFHKIHNSFKAPGVLVVIYPCILVSDSKSARKTQKIEYPLRNGGSGSARAEVEEESLENLTAEL